MFWIRIGDKKIEDNKYFICFYVAYVDDRDAVINLKFEEKKTGLRFFTSFLRLNTNRL